MKITSKPAQATETSVEEWLSDAEISAQEDELIQALMDEMSDPSDTKGGVKNGPSEFVAWSC